MIGTYVNLDIDPTILNVGIIGIIAAIVAFVIWRNR